jgi:hypothetical protein
LDNKNNKDELEAAEYKYIQLKSEITTFEDIDTMAINLDK